MGFLKKLFGGSGASANRNIYPLVVKCNRCGEIIEGEVNITNDLSAGEGDEADAGTYYCRKLLIGKQRCFQQLEVQLRFNKDRLVVDRQIVGGQFVDQ